MRECKVDLFEIFDMVNCAETFGFADDMILSFLADAAGKVTKHEISEYCEKLANTKGYSRDDGDSAFTTLTAWRKQYI